MKLERVSGIVTGGAGGLGRHMVIRLLKCGAAVATGDVDLPGLRALRREVGNHVDRLYVRELDVTDEASVKDFVERASAALGGVNVLINSAGILRDAQIVRQDGEELRMMTSAQWRKVLDVNLTGPFLMTREVVARIVRRGNGGGIVVNVSSAARTGHPGQANYSASKAGLDAATRAWALELAPYGIRVGGLAPGVIDTPFLQHVSEDALERLEAKTPLGRAGSTDEIWISLKYILECDFFTGRTLEVDGGMSMS